MELRIISVNEKQQFNIDDIVSYKVKDIVNNYAIDEICYRDKKYLYRIKQKDSNNSLLVDAEELIELNKPTCKENHWLHNVVNDNLGHLIFTGNMKVPLYLNVVDGFELYSSNSRYKPILFKIIYSVYYRTDSYSKCNEYISNCVNNEPKYNYEFMKEDYLNNKSNNFIGCIADSRLYLKSFTNSIRKNRIENKLSLKKIDELNNLIELINNTESSLLKRFDLLKDDFISLKINLEKEIENKNIEISNDLIKMQNDGKLRRVSRKYFNVINKNMNYNINRQEELIEIGIKHMYEIFKYMNRMFNSTKNLVI